MVNYIESNYKIAKYLDYFEKRRNSKSGLDYGGQKLFVPKIVK